MRAVRINITGQKFGRATVLGFSHINGQAYWSCRCDCGTEFVSAGFNLRKGITKSCGCLKRESGRNTKTHGDSKTKFYSIWASMKSRISNENMPTFNTYGGRGITICAEWLNYQNFRSDMLRSYLDHCEKFGSGHETTVDRINNDLGYSLENCKWSTQREQNNNRRDNVLINYQGTPYTRQEASCKFGIKKETISKRLKLGWSMEKSLTTPAGKQGKAS